MNYMMRETAQMNNRTAKFSRGLVFCFAFFSVLAAWFGAYGEAQAEGKLTLNVTPPLFQLNIGPGEVWASSLKVVNTNPYDVTLWASVMNFQSKGEEGQGKFIPLAEEDPEASAQTLAEWVDISKEPILVPKGKSAEVPFSVRIPADASPGGHYAAILVGNQPLAAPAEGAIVRVSGSVSSLLFVRIQGEVVEKGNIREFSTESAWRERPEAAFILRFENTGNVHLRPEGDIAIYNMWGGERGKIPVNQKTDFGNVLPQSIRKFVFEWQGEGGLLEAGMYKAVATLAYGEEARQHLTRATYFWVVPVKPFLGAAAGLAVFILVMFWAIRAYVRRILSLHSSLGRLSAAPSAEIPDAERQEQGLDVLEEPLGEEGGGSASSGDAKPNIEPEEKPGEELTEEPEEAGSPPAPLREQPVAVASGTLTEYEEEDLSFEIPVILYRPGKAAEAQAMNSSMGGKAFLKENEAQDDDIIVALGSNRWLRLNKNEPV